MSAVKREKEDNRKEECSGKLAIQLLCWEDCGGDGLSLFPLGSIQG